MRDDFCVFILTHGRAKNVRTAETLERQGYSGKLYIVIDDEDDQEPEYGERFGDKVLKFSKAETAKTFDEMVSGDRRTIVYARNACFELAKMVGCRYFLELDDDYVAFERRWIKNDRLMTEQLSDLDEAFTLMVDFLIESGAATVAMAQGGDFIGGKNGGAYKKGLLRKAMNTFFCDAERPFKFIGRINEDVNTYTTLGSRGVLMLTVTDMDIVQVQTQKSKGGMSDVYLDSGTYLKSMFTVMTMPSAVKVSQMGAKHKRIHHAVSWEHCVPKILNEKWRKL